jgi:hypothetical protein
MPPHGEESLKTTDCADALALSARITRETHGRASMAKPLVA